MSSSSSSPNQQQQQRQQRQGRQGQGTINNNNNIGSEELLLSELLQRKIDSATDGLTDHITTQLNKLALQQSKENALTICDYIAALTIEVNPVLLYKRTQIQVLCYLSSFYYDHDHHKTGGKQSKLFSEMRREDVLRYLDSLRKPEASDPLHHWIGTYNLRRIHLMRFFKWLYHPDLDPKNRSIPEVVQNIPQLKRKEFSTIKPTDLWSEEDDTLFLKYCPSARDRCYHTVSRDTSCRPSEILGLRIKDIVFKIAGDGSKQQYAMVVVNGKTGSRNLPLFNSIPYVKDWLTTHHPQKNNPNAYFIPSLDKRFRRFGNRLSSLSINKIYKNYKLLFFPALLKDPKVVPEDKEKIRDLLLKKWNPYIRRHSALTQKAQLLKTPLLKTHAGWSQRSTMNLKYEHWFGNEATESLLAEYGIIEPGSSLAKTRIISEKVRPKQCPNCSEANIPDCKFCSKCKMILNYDAYEETLEEQKKKDNKLKELEDRINTQQLAQEEQKRLQQEQKQVQEIQQFLLEQIAKIMNTHSSGIMEQELQDKNSDMNSEKFKLLTYEQKLQGISEIKADTKKVIQNNLLPEIANISKYMKENNMKAVCESIARIVGDKGFREMFFDVTPELRNIVEKRTITTRR